MNKTLLRKVKRRILARPEKYDQGTWCNTAFCIAGHTVMEAGNPEQLKEFRRIAKLVHAGEMRQADAEDFVASTARDLLQISMGEASLLFLALFPEQLDEAESESRALPTEKARRQAFAKVGAKRIDLFISSGGEI